MAISIFKILTNGKIKLPRKTNFSTSHSLMIKWRYEKGIEPNPNRFGKLTNLPDYSYVDGRPVPLSIGNYNRMKLQEAYCEKIVRLSKELDFAVKRHEEMEQQKKLERENILKSKLKKKG